jgi:hypothetical protein
VTRADLDDHLMSVAAADGFDAGGLGHLAHLLVVRDRFEHDLRVVSLGARDLDLPRRELEVEPHVSGCEERLAAP